MKSPRSSPSSGRSRVSLRVSFLTVAVAAFAPFVPTTPKLATAPTAKRAAEVILLNPFEVATNKDPGYGAPNTTSIGAINIEMHKSPVAAIHSPNCS